MTRIELSYQGPTTERPANVVRYVGYVNDSVLIANPSPRLIQELAHLGGKLTGDEWGLVAASETEIAALFDTLRNHGALFQADEAGWPPAAIFELYREKGLLSGRFHEVYFRRNDQGWSIYENGQEGDTLPGGEDRPGLSYEGFQTFVNEQFAFLFAEHGFATVHLDEVAFRGDRYLMGLEGATCRIEIIRTLFGADVGIGPRNAPFGWLFNTDPDEPRWYSAEAVAEFVTDRKQRLIDWSQIYSINDILARIARKIEPVVPQMMAAVADPRVRPEIEAYQRTYR